MTKKALTIDDLKEIVGETMYMYAHGVEEDAITEEQAVNKILNVLEEREAQTEYYGYEQGLEAGKIIAREQERTHIKLCAKEQSCSMCMEYLGRNTK